YGPSVALTSYMQQPTTVSVGPYSLTSRVSGTADRQKSRCSYLSISPPITRALAFFAVLLFFSSNPFSICKWLGVNFSRHWFPVSRYFASSATPADWGRITTLPPVTSAG